MARATAGSLPRPLAPRPVPLPEAVGQRLATDLRARCPLPPADLSAMDGWAVAGPPPWRVVADLLPGSLPGAGLTPGECARIATGAVVPPGTLVVLPVEESARVLDRVHPASPGWHPTRCHIRRAGEEAHRGDQLLAAGAVVSPPVAGLAAAAGHDTLTVQPAATVEVLVLGDELAGNGLPAAGRTRDALGPQLPGWLAAFGCPPRSVSRLGDRRATLVAALTRSTADVVVTTGGTSVGPHDHVRAALAEAGGRVVVDGVLVKPGHPMLLAALPGDRWLAGLPGNPYAACAALLTLVQPLLRRLRDDDPDPLDTVLLGSDQPGRRGDVHRLLPVRRHGERAEVLPSCGAAMLRGLAAADGLVVVPPAGAAGGQPVDYLPLPWTRPER